MPDLRAYCDPTAAEPVEITLDADESHHLVVVNRARLGDPVVVFNGRGTEWVCELVGDRRQAAVLRVRSKPAVKRLPFSITLAQALPKGPGMDAIVRKATEIGAERIVPLVTERTQVHLDDDRSEKKIEKWRTAALEAAKQCGNAFLPAIDPVTDAQAFMADPGLYDLKLIASLGAGARSLKHVLTEFSAANGRPPRRALWMIGPEGDFSPAELDQARTHGFAPITLGPLVLRCETAAVYALSILSYELQNPS